MHRSLITIHLIMLVAAVWISAATAANAQESTAVEFHAMLPSQAMEASRRELERLHTRLQQELGARPLSQPAQIYVYAQVDHFVAAVREIGIEPGGRPAIFLKRNGKSYIFTYAHGDYRQTLRHEFTHAVLHDSFANFPIWLDEGLAEFYETVSGRQPAYERLLATQLRIVWNPSPSRMSQWRKMEDMRMLEYAEAWSWVRLFMQSPGGREHIRFWLANSDQTRWTKTLSQAAEAWEDTYR